MKFISGPQPLQSSDLNFNAITDSGFLLYLNKSTSTRVDQYKIEISPKPTEGQSEYLVPFHTTSLEIIHLKSSAEYSVQVFTSLQGKLSKTAAVRSVYTSKYYDFLIKMRMSKQGSTALCLQWCCGIHVQYRIPYKIIFDFVL